MKFRFCICAVLWAETILRANLWFSLLKLDLTKIRVYSNWRMPLALALRQSTVFTIFFKKLVLIWYHSEEGCVPFHSTKAEPTLLLQRLEREFTWTFAQGIPLRVRQFLEALNCQPSNLISVHSQSTALLNASPLLKSKPFGVLIVLSPLSSWERWEKSSYYITPDVPPRPAQSIVKT